MYASIIKVFKTLTNPPFYENSLKASTLSKNMARHDDGLSLSGLMANVKRLMAADAFVAVLYPAAASSALEEHASRAGLALWAKASVHQTTTHAAFRTMYFFKGVNSAPVAVQTIFIKNETGSYTDEFRTLLTPFYLNF
jgi:tRNA1Val (adenine37-N6)-methyltransferase